MNSYQQADDQISNARDSLEVVGGMLQNYDLSKFRIFKSKTLFEPNREDLIRWLSQMKCPLCQKKLYWNLKKDKAFCKSKKKDGFFITKGAMEKFRACNYK